jgi:hypothetical protein
VAIREGLLSSASVATLSRFVRIRKALGAWENDAFALHIDGAPFAIEPALRCFHSLSGADLSPRFLSQFAFAYSAHALACPTESFIESLPLV